MGAHGLDRPAGGRRGGPAGAPDRAPSPPQDDANGCVLSDADLAILAAPAERYAEYVADVRREYAHVPDDLFAAGRAAVLRELLAKPSLFHTRHAREHWEAPARANVEAELARLV